MQRSISRRDFGKLVAGGPALLALQPPWNDWAAAQSLRNELKDLSGELSFDEAVLQAAADDFGHVVHEKPAFMLRPSDAQDIAKAVREPPGSQGRDARPGAFVFRADPGRGRRGHRFQQPEFGPHRQIRRGRDRLARSLWTTPSCSIERCLVTSVRTASRMMRPRSRGAKPIRTLFDLCLGIISGRLGHLDP